MECVDEARAERGFGADDGEPDVILSGEREEAFNIGRGNVHILGIERGASVARGNENAICTRALAQLPRQGMFTSAISNDENVHSTDVKL